MRIARIVSAVLAYLLVVLSIAPGLQNTISVQPALADCGGGGWVGQAPGVQFASYSPAKIVPPIPFPSWLQIAQTAPPVSIVGSSFNGGTTETSIAPASPLAADSGDVQWFVDYQAVTPNNITPPSTGGQTWALVANINGNSGLTNASLYVNTGALVASPTFSIGASTEMVGFFFETSGTSVSGPFGGVQSQADTGNSGYTSQPGSVTPGTANDAVMFVPFSTFFGTSATTGPGGSYVELSAPGFSTDNTSTTMKAYALTSAGTGPENPSAVWTGASDYEEWGGFTFVINVASGGSSTACLGMVAPTPTPTPGVACVQANYPTGSAANDGPFAANWCPFSPSSAWNNTVPANPLSTSSPALQTAMQSYITNTPYQYFTMQADSAGTGKVGGYPAYITTSSDVAVTLVCDQHETNCTLNDITTYNPTGTIVSTTGYIPSYAQPGCNLSACPDGDNNLTIIQPNGTEWDLYDCKAYPATWSAGTIGSNSAATGGGCAGIAVSTTTSTSVFGITGASSSAGTLLVYGNIKYNEMFPSAAVPPIDTASIHHAIIYPASCTTGAPVYPAQSSTFPCSSGGVPAGQRFCIARTMAQADTIISSNSIDTHLRPLIYATLCGQYGGYITDTYGGSTPGMGCASSTACGVSSLAFETPQAWMQNSQTNLWIPWFTAVGAAEGTNGSGANFYYVSLKMLGPFASYVVALQKCYAYGAGYAGYCATP